MRDTITKNVTAAVAGGRGRHRRQGRARRHVRDPAQGAAGQAARGPGAVEREIPFALPGSLTRVYAVASGKGGVGKSSVTVNLAAAMARSGLAVGVVDADIYGHSVPRMLGVEGRPTQVEDMILPPVAHDVKVISIGMFVANNQPVVWRGPMLHRALQQFLGDVYWGDLDVLLMDLPPGTGDIAISVAQLVPPAELLVVTTPQQAAAEVAERAGTIALQTHQQIAGVVENMSYLPCPHCDERIEVFGSRRRPGGGRRAQPHARRAGAAARPDPDRHPAARGRRLRPPAGARPTRTARRRRRCPRSPTRSATGARGLAGRSLGLSPAGPLSRVD